MSVHNCTVTIKGNAIWARDNVVENGGQPQALRLEVLGYQIKNEWVIGQDVLEYTDSWKGRAMTPVRLNQGNQGNVVTNVTSCVFTMVEFVSIAGYQNRLGDQGPAQAAFRDVDHAFKCRMIRPNHTNVFNAGVNSFSIVNGDEENLGYQLYHHGSNSPDYSQLLDCQLNVLCEYGNNVMVSSRSGDSWEDPKVVKVGVKSGLQMALPRTAPE